MPKSKTILIPFAVVLCAVSFVRADTINLKNGGSVEGIVEQENGNGVEVNTGFGTITFNKSQIKNIERASAEESRDMARGWEERRAELESKEKEFEEARDNRLKSAYKNLMEDARAKKLQEEGGAKQIDISREPGGKGIIVEVLLNKKVKVKLMLDTGASVIALSRKVGEELGIDLSDRKKDAMEMRLADGRKTTAKAIVLDSVSIQGIEVKNVTAAIMIDQVPNVGITQGLLGMSFLSKFNLRTNFKDMKMSLEKIEEGAP